MLYFTHPDCQLHDMGAHHPESPARLRAIEQHLKDAGLWQLMEHRQAQPASLEQISLAHDHDYIQTLFNRSPHQGSVDLDADTRLNPHSLDASLLAAGAAVQAVDAVFDPQQASAQAFCAVRPPGHHAERQRAMGFCIFNNVAIAALYAIDKYRLARVAIVDFDVHHGNGTEHIVAGNPAILLLSSFQHPWYPGTGVPSSAANVVNFPLPAGSGSEVVRRLWQEQLQTYLVNFQPQLILVSAGFDAHTQDPLAQLNFVDDDYRFFAQQLKTVADSCCGGRLVACLEGGYHLSALGRSVVAFLQPWVVSSSQTIATKT